LIMVLRREPRATKRAGFTLMEMLIVVAIIVVLAGVGGVVYLRVLDESKVNVAKSQAKILAEAVAMYELSCGRYPANLEELTQPQDGKKALLEPSALIDPWSRPYQLAVPGPHHPTTGAPDVWSLGPTGDQNGAVGNW